LGKSKEAIASESLADLLKDKEVKIRAEAAKALGKIGDARTIAPLVAALQKETDWEVRESIGEALARTDKLAVEPLITALRHPRVEVRTQTTQILGRIGDVRSVELLIEVPQDKEPELRAQAVRALGEVGDLQAIAPLLDALKGRDESGRRHAAEALAEIGEPAVDILKTELTNTHSSVRKHAAAALGIIGLPQAVRALGKIRDKRAVRALISAQKDDVVEVRREAAEALGRIGRVDSIEPLTRALRKDEALEVRSQAAEALGEIGDTRTVLSLITALGDTESHVRECVAKVLGKMGDSQAIEPLTNLFEHETHEKVKKAAADALHRLKDTRGFD